MIRVGQMLLATALKRHFTGSADDPIECKFLDDPCATRSPFSIFEFIRAAHGREVAVPPSETEAAREADACNPGGRQGMRSGSSCGVGGFRTGRQLTQKMPGDWFGPTTISETIAALVERNKDLRDSLAVYVDADGVLYEDEVRALAEGLEGPRWKPPPSSPSLCSASWKPWHSHSDRATEESEDEFQVLSTASNICSPPLSVSSASNICSPPLLPVSTDALDDLEEEPRNSDITEFLEFELPPAVVPLEPCDEEAAELIDATLFGREVRAVSSSSAPAEETKWKRDVLLLFPLQLGCEKYVGEDRVSAVLRYFEIGSSLGAMGGRPRMAHFFVGCQGQGLLYVDPHVVQAAVPASRPDAGENHSGGFAGAETFRNLPTVQTIPVEHIDSSISFAFYVRSEAALSELVKTLRGIEAAEASAPIRVESTRPAALRHVEVTDSWGDSDLVLEESAEVAAEEPSFHDAGSSGYPEEKLDVLLETQETSLASFISDAAPEHSSAASANPGTDLYVVGEEDLCWPLFEARNELKPSTVSLPGGTVGLPDGGTIYVGSSWADGRWAQVDRRTVSHSVSAT